MDISVPYKQDFMYMDKIQEIDIKFTETSDYVNLLKFVEQFSHYRINLEIQKPDFDFAFIKVLMKANSNIYLKLNGEYIPYIPKLQEMGIRYYFTYTPGNWESLTSLIEAKPSDIYIMGELGFNLIAVKSILREYNIRVRTVVNVALVDDPFRTLDSNRRFFIRPEDLELYAGLIDTIEFMIDSNHNLNTLFEIYIIDKHWFGNLSEIVTNLPGRINNPNLLSEFTRKRIDCKQRCYQGSPCRLCDAFVNLANEMEDRDFHILKDLYNEST